MSVEGECENDSSEIIFSKIWVRVVILSPSEKDGEHEYSERWPTKDEPLTSSFGFRSEKLNVKSCVTVETCYALFVANKLFLNIAEQTNLYA